HRIFSGHHPVWLYRATEGPQVYHPSGRTPAQSWSEPRSAALTSVVVQRLFVALLLFCPTVHRLHQAALAAPVASPARWPFAFRVQPAHTASCPCKPIRAAYVLPDNSDRALTFFGAAQWLHQFVSPAVNTNRARH